MKKIGMIGGMSWESSLVYYQLVNEMVKDSLGGFHSCTCVMESVDFSEIEGLQHAGDWDRLDQRMANSAQNLEKAGADFIILCTNTMHLCSEAIEQSISIPFLHIAQATGDEIKMWDMDRVLLLGTKFTMEKDFYKKLLNEEFGIEVMVPSSEDRETVHKIIYEELVQGKITEQAKACCQDIIRKSASEGAQGVILGCTELPLLIKEGESDLPVFDTMRIHAERAVAFALEE